MGGDTEDINKLTYQKTGLCLVLEFWKWQRTMDWTAVAVPCSPGISGSDWSKSSPVLVFFQFWDWTSKHYF